MARKPNLKERRVTVVLADPWHTLHLVELKTKVREHRNEEDDSVIFTVDAAIEEEAKQRLKKPDKPWHGYDVVGVLVAQDDPLHRGRILWAKTVDVTQAVEL